MVGGYHLSDCTFHNSEDNMKCYQSEIKNLTQDEG
jgi:hypothetical protein